MNKFRLSLLTVMSSITCTAAEPGFGIENLEAQTPGSEPLEITPIAPGKTSSFRKYVSVDLLNLTRLFARFNFGFRNENGSNGYDLGISGGRGRIATMFGGYASYLHYFHPESAFNFYGGIGVDSGVVWGNMTYGAIIQGIVPIGLAHKAKTGRNEFFQINLIWPSISYQKIYRRSSDDFYFEDEGDLTLKSWGSGGYHHEDRDSYLKRNLKTIGINMSYGLFF